MSVVADDLVRIAAVDKARGYWATVLRRLSRDPVSVVCATIILLIALAAIFAPYLGLADPYQGSMIRRLRRIGTPGYPLGTDELGRDMLSRLIYGGRLSLFIGLMPVVLAFMHRHDARRHGRLSRRLRQSGDHAHHRRVLRVPLGAARDRDLRRARRRHRQLASCRSPSCSFRRSCASPKA